ncbi:MAG: holo-ACP synthase [Betaproteobacteria bacterium]|nr:holo-ACP synthase [Betaproteobacteria bacterium]
MIYGIGVDLVETSRIERLLNEYGERFARRVLTELEWPGYQRTKKPVLFVANRFAAKEAFSKAMGTGFRYPVTLQNISVVQNKLGKPSYAVSKALGAMMAHHEICGHHLTISDEKSMACAVAILEK